MLFRNRTEAGRELARHLIEYAHRSDVIVLALPRGGVPVAAEVAQALQAPLDVFLVRKLGVPGHEELGMGAIAGGDIQVLNDLVVRAHRLTSQEIESVLRREKRELQRRERLYRGDAPPLDLRGQIVILIDDGLATGSTMRAAIAALRQQGPAEIVVAVPVGAPEICEDFQDEADRVICARTPEPFYSVGQWYDDFTQTTDDEVHSLLAQAAAEHVASP